MRILITGASGFVAAHLVYALRTDNNNHVIIGTARTSKINVKFDNFYVGDMLEPLFLINCLKEAKPDVIIHLASQSSVALSWNEPNHTFNNNVNIFLNLLEAVRKINYRIRVISVGSSEEYGNSKSLAKLKEDSQLNPKSPYAVARVAQTQLALLYAGNFNLDVVATRSFNHYGPNQRLGFVIPDFITKILNYKNTNVKVTVGNLEVVRDLVNVMDIVDAYIKLIYDGKPGSLYNICTGNPTKLIDLLLLIFEIVGVIPCFEINKELIRPSENNYIVGDNSRIINEIGWKPKITLREGLINVYESFYR